MERTYSGTDGGVRPAADGETACAEAILEIEKYGCIVNETAPQA
jgi:hypothetical protein